MKNAFKEMMVGAIWAMGGVLSAIIPGALGGAIFAACEANEKAIRGGGQ